MSRKTFKYRLYPNRQQRERLQATLDVCRELYNAALQERRDGYRTSRAKLNYYTQANQLSEIKEIRPDIASVHSQVLQDTLRRLDKSFQSFFRRLQQGQKPGFPRFQGIHSVRFFHVSASRISSRRETSVVEDRQRKDQVASRTKGRSQDPDDQTRKWPLVCMFQLCG